MFKKTIVRPLRGVKGGKSGRRRLTPDFLLSDEMRKALVASRDQLGRSLVNKWESVSSPFFFFFRSFFFLLFTLQHSPSPKHASLTHNQSKKVTLTFTNPNSKKATIKMSESTTAPSMRSYLEMTLANVAYLDAADAAKPPTAPEYEPSRYQTAITMNDDSLVVIFFCFTPPYSPLILNNCIASTTSTPPWEATSTVSTLFATFAPPHFISLLCSSPHAINCQGHRYQITGQMFHN